VQTTAYGWFGGVRQERPAQVPDRSIDRSKPRQSQKALAVRIGKEVDSTFKAGDKMTVRHLGEPLFVSFQKGSAKKSRISDTSELVGFDSCKPKDQDEIRSLIAGKQAVAAELKTAVARHCPTHYFASG
jgi:hypothetical protein